MKLYLWAFKKTIGTAPWHTAVIYILNLVLCLIQPLSLYAYQQTINTATLVNGQSALVFLGIIVITNISTTVVSQRIALTNKIICHLVAKKYSLILFDEAFATPLHNLDQNEYLLDYERAKTCVNDQIGQTISGIASLVSQILSVILVSCLIANSSVKCLAMFIFMGVLQNIYVKRNTTEQIRLSKENEPLQKKYRYFTELLRDRNASKEIRLFNAFSWIDDKRKTSFSTMYSKILSSSVKWTWINIAWAICMYGIECTVNVYLVMQVQQGKIDISTMLLLIQSQVGIITGIGGVVRGISGFTRTGFYIDSFKRIYDRQVLTKNTSNTSNTCERELAFAATDVCYAYREKDVIKNVNLKIRKGEHVAVVGNNGSGKSTLAKVILGLLVPQHGSVVYGTNRVAAVFQDQAKYMLSLREIIGLGRTEALGDSDLMARLLALVGAGNMINKCPHGLDTNIGTEIYDDGYDISGGEWQKVSVARALFSNSEIVIFDESTSSLDPISEIEQFDVVSNYLNYVTVVFVTHRIWAAMNFDKVIVMEGGKIIEQGAPLDLLRKRGAFSRLLHEQSSLYREKGMRYEQYV